ncbi:MAG: hypothetical protein ACOZCO_08255 [Bacteroidota bacterium]
MIRLHLMNYIHLIRFLNNPEKALLNYSKKIVNNGQLLLYET